MSYDRLEVIIGFTIIVLLAIDVYYVKKTYDAMSAPRSRYG